VKLEVERLEKIISKRKADRIDAAPQLTLLKALRADVEGAQRIAQKLGLEQRGYAIYELLRQARSSKPRRRRAATAKPNATWPSSSTRPSRR